MNIGEKRQSKISFLTACGRRLGWDFRGAGKLEQETRETVSTGGRPKKKEQVNILSCQVFVPFSSLCFLTKAVHVFFILGLSFFR